MHHAPCTMHHPPCTMDHTPCTQAHLRVSKREEDVGPERCAHGPSEGQSQEATRRGGGGGGRCLHEAGGRAGATVPSVGGGAKDHRKSVDARLRPQVSYPCHTHTPAAVFSYELPLPTSTHLYLTLTWQVHLVIQGFVPTRPLPGGVCT